ncbi:hypothetical protein FB451DRAFT_1490988 [Mycena latifolia]|nr:hypothetical protein FB451DRAFT_1490988 [Mycena latifolia]
MSELSESPAYFLLSIAINEYQCPTIHNLQGSLNDAAMLEVCLADVVGPVPPSAICSLRNAGATRSAILAAFYKHLITNPHIKKDDPIIIYYAGHGGRVRVPESWMYPDDESSVSDATIAPDAWGTSSDSFVETLCPSDEGTRSGDDLVYGIPDITINALLRILAREKGNNITFICDSCHSGGICRDIADENPGFRARCSGTNLSPLPPDIDSAILADANCGGPGCFGFHGNHSSHILLAACTEAESAYENDIKPRTASFATALTREFARLGLASPMGSALDSAHGTDAQLYSGLFTTALIRELRRLGAGGLASTTYAALMGALKLPHSGQHPQCEGNFINSFLFSRRAVLAPCVFQLTAQRGGDFLIAAGEAHGIVVGTEMTVYRDSCARNRLGLLVCRRVEAVSSTGRISTETKDIKIPAHSWVAVHRWHTGELKIYAPAFPSCVDVASEYPFISTRFKRTAHVALQIRTKGPKPGITVERPGDLLLAPYTRNSVVPTIPRELHLPSVLTKIAHFHFHLARQKPQATKPQELDGVVVGDTVELHMYHMKAGRHGFQPERNNLLRNNTARLELTDAPWYGFEITSKSRWGLYVYLFCFDPSDYSIAALWMPPLGSASPPLTPFGSITIGYGRDGGLPLRFSPQSPDVKCTDTVFFKLFVSTNYLNMHHIPQLSPLDAPQPSPPVSEPSKPDAIPRGPVAEIMPSTPPKALWDVSLSTVTISKGRQGLFARLW